MDKVISGIIKVKVSVISQSQRLRLITLTETLIIFDMTNSESHNCFIIHCFKENNDKPFITCELDAALGNHALRAQPMDYPLIF